MTLGYIGIDTYAIDRFDGVHGRYGEGQRDLQGRMLLKMDLEKESCMSNTWLNKEEKTKIILRMRENETKIKTEYWWILQNVKVIPWIFQHALVVADIHISRK